MKVTRTRETATKTKTKVMNRNDFIGLRVIASVTASCKCDDPMWVHDPVRGSSEMEPSIDGAPGGRIPAI
jgi:hypothetical protein